MGLWNYRSRGWAERMWNRWYGWAIRSRLEPVKTVARMIKGRRNNNFLELPVVSL